MVDELSSGNGKYLMAPFDPESRSRSLVINPNQWLQVGTLACSISMPLINKLSSGNGKFQDGVKVTNDQSHQSH